MPLIDTLTMSTSQSKTATSSSASDPAAKSTVPPTPLHDTPLAKAIAHGRPAVLAALLYFGMGYLIEDPVSTLKISLPIVAVVQTAYVTCCLPVAGSQAAKGSKKLRPGEKKKSSDGPKPNILVVSAPKAKSQLKLLF